MYFIYGLMCLIFGTTFLAIKIGVAAAAPPFLFAGTRFLTAGIVMLFALKLSGESIGMTSIQRRDAVFVGMTMTAILFGCLYWGEQYISSSVAALLSATAPLMIVMIDWVKGNKASVTTKAAGLVLAFGGVSVAVFPALGARVGGIALLAVLFIGGF